MKKMLEVRQMVNTAMHVTTATIIFRSHTLHLDIIKVFIYQLMHERVALKECYNLH